MASTTPVQRKRRFDIHVVLRRIRDAVSEHADAAMFELAAVFQARGLHHFHPHP